MTHAPACDQYKHAAEGRRKKIVGTAAELMRKMQMLEEPSQRALVTKWGVRRWSEQREVDRKAGLGWCAGVV